jgi:hypothetical protein
MLGSRIGYEGSGTPKPELSCVVKQRRQEGAAFSRDGARRD